MELPNVNNLNSVPNFGHGLPADGIVKAGVTDVPQNMQEDISEETVEQEVTNPIEENEKETTEVAPDENVTDGEGEKEEVNG